MLFLREIKAIIIAIKITNNNIPELITPTPIPTQEPITNELKRTTTNEIPHIDNDLSLLCFKTLEIMKINKFAINHIPIGMSISIQFHPFTNWSDTC